MATTLRVDTASTPGGDGTTWNLTGANRAYASLEEARTANAGTDLTGTGPMTFLCRASTGVADTGGTMSLYNFTTTASDYIEIKPDTGHRHAGVWDDTKYRIVMTTGYGISVRINYVRIDGLQIDEGGTGGYCIAEIFTSGAYGAAELRISNCILKGGARGISFAGDNSDATVAKVWNNIIYDQSAIGIRCGGTASYSRYLYNNTIQNCGTGITQSVGDVVAINTLISGCTAAASGTFAVGTDYNSTDSVGMGYTVTGNGNTHDQVGRTFTFVNGGADNFHLGSGDVGAKDLGVSDPGSGLFSDDIDGVTRAGAWDIGADEVVATARPAYYYAQL